MDTSKHEWEQDVYANSANGREWEQRNLCKTADSRSEIFVLIRVHSWLNRALDNVAYCGNF